MVLGLLGDFGRERAGSGGAHIGAERAHHRSGTGGRFPENARGRQCKSHGGRRRHTENATSIHRGLPPKWRVWRSGCAQGCVPRKPKGRQQQRLTRIGARPQSGPRLQAQVFRPKSSGPGESSRPSLHLVVQSTTIILPRLCRRSAWSRRKTRPRGERKTFSRDCLPGLSPGNSSRLFALLPVSAGERLLESLQREKPERPVARFRMIIEVLQHDVHLLHDWNLSGNAELRMQAETVDHPEAPPILESSTRLCPLLGVFPALVQPIVSAGLVVIRQNRRC